MQENKKSNLLNLFIYFLLGFFVGNASSGKFSLSNFGFSKINAPSNIVVYKDGKKQTVDVKRMWEVWQALELNYYDKSKLDEAKMVEGGASGIADAIGDRYTYYLPKELNKTVSENLQGEFGGVGIQIGINKDNQLTVMSVLKNTPAQNAGLKAGDVIVHIKDDAKGIDEDVVDWNIMKAVETIRGPIGSSLTLSIFRKGADKEIFDVDITRQKIVIPSTEFKVLNKNGQKIAYVAIFEFSGNTYEAWDKIVKQIQKENIQNIILDLRDNPGGFLETAVDIASDFIPQGMIVKQEGIKEMSTVYVSKGYGRLKDKKVVVLVNKGSASASEILAGALRDRNHVLIIGETTFGKGTVQNVLDFDDGASLHVTVAKWILPNGDWINHKGIKPDIEVKEDDTNEDKDLVLEKALEQF